MKLKFAFIGGGYSGFNLIKALLKANYMPEFGIILKEDEHETEKYSEKLISFLKKKKVKVSLKKKLSDADYKLIRQIRPDFIIVLGWRTIINLNLCGKLKHGIIAAHFSLLPKYRGFAPVQWAIINGESETGVTLFKIGNDEIDSGDVILQKKIKILKNDTSFDVIEKLSDFSVEMYLQFIKSAEKNQIVCKKQNNSLATYCCKRIPGDGRIDWSKTSLEIHNLIRALANPFPGAFCYLDNKCFHITKAELGKDNNKKFAGRIIGRVIKIFNDGIEVLCGEGTIFLKQWENKSDGKLSCPSETIKSLSSTLS